MSMKSVTFYYMALAWKQQLSNLIAEQQCSTSEEFLERFPKIKKGIDVGEEFKKQYPNINLDVASDAMDVMQAESDSIYNFLVSVELLYTLADIKEQAAHVKKQNNPEEFERLKKCSNLLQQEITLDETWIIT
jgi:hypothetical protein